MAEPSVFMLHPAGGPTLVPPVRFSSQQSSVGVFGEVEWASGTRMSFPPQFGAPNFAEILERIPGAKDADYFIHWAMPATTPRNVAAFPGRKVLILGDTQHSNNLWDLLRYAVRERFDVIFAEKRQHAHWFAEAGLGPVHWLPGIVADPRTLPFSDERRREILIVGHVNKSHARRGKFIEELKRRGYPVRHTMCRPQELAQLYSGSLIALNISLNGDANLRFFEVPAAGGFLLTDRLSDLAGVGTFYREGEHYAAYGDFDELCAKLDLYLNDPQAAFLISQRGQQQFMANLTRAETVARFWRVVETGTDEPNFALALEPRLRRSVTSLDEVLTHLDVYQDLQEINRTAETPNVLLLPGASSRIAADSADLNRLALFTLDTDAFSVAEARDMGLTAHLRTVSLDDARGMSWASVIGRAGGAQDARTFTAEERIILD